ncbi:hypothetical protein JTB14_030468 [Gonioctena quinquepunctata]|nr:hypothetical protein JTB14_030468 [Gonioctena quinquepunctata]
MAPQEKSVVLSYDEMKVRNIFEYHKKSNEIIGPHDYVQVLIARSSFGNCKQPVHEGFDKNMSKKSLYEIISALYDISFDVVAVVSDCGPSNQNTPKELNVSFTRNYLKHPGNNNKIFRFLDAPHLLKLIRNWLLKTGFLLSSEKKVHKNILEDLISRTADTEVSSIFKLSEKHLSKRTEKQNVTLASQLLSHSTATAIKRYNTEESNNLEYFIQFVNDWFDTMNLRNLKESQDFKKPYQAHKEQKAILLSIRSLKELSEEMEKRNGINFILTSKLNRNAVENLFGQLRSRGGLDYHPTPMNLLYRLRMVVLGK